MRERDGRIVLRPVHSGEKVVITDEVLFAIEKGATIYTDEGNAYRDLHLWYTHETINHGIGEYVRQEITTNGMESVWAIVKRAHKGVYPPLVEETRCALSERGRLPPGRR